MTEPGRDPDSGRFLPGNRFWEARSSAGPDPKFETPDQLWAACIEYFNWNVANPLYEDKLVSYQGETKHEPVAKMRAMTIAGLCIFLDVTPQRWGQWRRERPDLLSVMDAAENVIRTQKFEGAAADLLNPNIIARDLGLSEKSELTGKDGGPIQTEEVGKAADAFTRRIAGLAARAGAAEAPGRAE